MELSNMFYCFLPFILLTLFNSASNFALAESNEVKQFRKLANSEQYIAVLFTKKCCDCVECVEAEALISLINIEILQTFNTVIAKLTDERELASEYGVKDYPALLYLRNKQPIIYDGNFEKEEIFDWLARSQEVALKTLDDGSFEHLTQASTGATTGDWLVLFHDSTCEKPNTFLFAILDNVALKLKGKMNVAKVDTEQSTSLKDRFNVNSCPFVMYFRLGKMYKYDIPSFTTSSLISFVEGFYRNSKGVPVPKIQTPFDKLVEYCALYIKENKSVSAAAGISFLLLSIGSLWFFGKTTPKEKTK